MKHPGFLLLFLFLLACQSGDNKSPNPSTDPLFVSIEPNSSGVEFVNQVEDGAEVNILTYRNFYNGGGVAIGDINQDGLQDIYFTANMGANRLYLNQGDWQFEDITETAGVAGTRAWSTGVSMVDLNADGWLDIYVCNSGDVQGDNKENELFLNQGDNTFVEAAAQWNLNQSGFSTHASFFDYDGDGDLDCYLLNNSFRSPDRIELYRKTRDQVHPEGGDKLLRNDGNTFTDVTLEAGIYSSDIGFGLGVSVSDLNGDLRPDIYVSNDFWERDYLYLNQGDGTFSEQLDQRLGICSFSSMGADVADLNNDGFPDIMSTDMLPGDNQRLKTLTQFTPFYLKNIQSDASYHYQILQNCLQLNDGKANFQEIAHLSGVAATDWSWGALLFDFDNDGSKDVFVANGILKDLTDLDFVSFISDREEVREQVEQSKRADFRDFLPYMPSAPLPNYAFVNQGDLRFHNQATELGLSEPSFSNGAAYGDLDGDGDLDLVVNNVNMPAFLYQNQATQKGQQSLSISFQGPKNNPLGIGAKVEMYQAGQLAQSHQQFLSRSFQSSVAPGLILGLGETNQLDSLVVTWPDGAQQSLGQLSAGKTMVLRHQDAQDRWQAAPAISSPIFTDQSQQLLPATARHQENEFNDFDHERLLPRMLSTEGPKSLVADVNDDGREDFLLLGAADQPNQLFLQQANGTFRLQRVSAFGIDAVLEATCAAFVDVDGDKDLDLLVGHGGNEFQKGRKNFQIKLYENDGNGQFFTNLLLAPPGGGNLSTIAAHDFDGDGDEDLFLGGRAVPGNYGLIPLSFLVENLGAEIGDNLGDNKWKDLTFQAMGQAGMVTDACWVDTDRDGDKDLVVVGEWMPIKIFVNNEGELGEVRTIPNSEGWWQTVEVADLNGDGQEELVLGNWGLNSKLQASAERPMSLFVKDFDKNGKSEFILNWFPPLDDQAFPFPTKMDLQSQLPELKKVSLKYEAYARQSYETLFSPPMREGALAFQTTQLQSSILWLDEAGPRLEALPVAAQLAPVFAISAADVNGDGQIDLVLGGNFYGLKPEIGRLDASRGLVLLGQQGGGWKALSSAESGLFLQGEVRDLQRISIAGKGPALLVSRNNDQSLIFTQD